MFVNLFVNLSTLYSFYENSTRVNSLSSISWGLSTSNIKWFLSGKKNSRIIRYNQNPLFVNKNDNFNYRENYIVIIISRCNALLIGWKNPVNVAHVKDLRKTQQSVGTLPFYFVRFVVILKSIGLTFFTNSG